MGANFHSFLEILPHLLLSGLTRVSLGRLVFVFLVDLHQHPGLMMTVE